MSVQTFSQLNPTVYYLLFDEAFIFIIFIFLCTVHFALCSVNYALWNLRWLHKSIKYTLNSTFCTLFFEMFTVHCVLCPTSFILLSPSLIHTVDAGTIIYFYWKHLHKVLIPDSLDNGEFNGVCRTQDWTIKGRKNEEQNLAVHLVYP